MKAPLETDDLTLSYLESVPYLVLRRSPLISRPPSNFQLDRRLSGRYYDVWKRVPDAPRVYAHVSLGRNVFEPSQEPRCPQVRALGARARESAGASRSSGAGAAGLRHRRGPAPEGWVPYEAWPGSLVPVGPGRDFAELRVDRAARYAVWIEGAFGRRVSVKVDGREVGHVSRRPAIPASISASAT